MMAETQSHDDVLSRPIHVTVWKSMAPREKSGGPTTLVDLAASIKRRSADSKEQLWWLKLARFGDQPNEKGYLRHNENLIECEGLEADYDAGKISFDEAVEIAEKAGLACLIYTSPSNTEDFPKWRILAPFTEPMDPIQRDHMMGRLNGLYRGVFDPASWTLSQSYYYGYVNGNEENHRVELVEGTPIDELDELDEIWMPKPLRAAKFSENEAHDSAYRRHAFDADLDIDQVYTAIQRGDNFHNAMLSLAAHLFGKGYEREEVLDALTEAMDSVPKDSRDKRWRARASTRHINSILNWLSTKENRKLFKRLREKEERQEDARTSPHRDWNKNPEPEAEEEPSEAPPGNEKKEKKQTATNALTLRRALRRHADMAGLVGFDEFALHPVLLRPIPDPDKKRNDPFEPRPWEDNDDIRLALWYQSIGYLKATKGLANDVVQILADEARFHPVRDYLTALTWDGVPRAAELMTRGFGASGVSPEEQEYLSAVGKAALIGATARVMRPGCKVDTMIILEGRQGALKSSGVRALCPNANWFSDTMPSDLDHKDAREHLPGKWLIEMSEISQLRKSEVESLKSFLSTQVDKYRPSYGRANVSRQRQCLFIGTTNEDAYLSDATGNRRFWPVKVGTIDLPWITENRDQLWAEALHAFRAGEKWWLGDQAAEFAADAQQERMVTDEWEKPVLEYLQGRADGVWMGDILKGALYLDTTMQGKPEQARVTSILKKAGYRRAQKKVAGYPQWLWYPPAVPG